MKYYEIVISMNNITFLLFSYLIIENTDIISAQNNKFFISELRYYFLFIFSNRN